MKELEFKDLKNLVPGLNLDKVITLSDNEKEKYARLYSLYANLLIQYIDKKTGLSSYEKKLVESDLNFEEIKESDMDAYQFVCSDYLKFFYLRNSLQLEKLNKEDYQALMTKLENGDSKLTDLDEELIDRTFRDVIAVKNDDNDIATMVQYGPDSSNYRALGSNLIIGFRYDEFADDGLSDDAWDEQHDKQMIFINDTLTDLESEANQKMKCNVNVLQYNEFSVIKKSEKKSEIDKEDR